MPAGVALFRALIIASVATGLAGSCVDILFPSLVPDALSKAFETLPATAMPALVIAGALLVVTFGGTIAAIVGLYYFQPWARTLALWLTVLSLLFYPLFGVSIQSGWSQLLLEISTTLWGAILAISYVSSLSTRFTAQPQNS